MNKLRDSKGLYWWLVGTFGLLYMCVGFVSTLHSITFFELANTMWLAVLLGITYEVGQATVLFSILMSKNSQNILPWGLMILLTALQVTANVYASFKFMDGSGSLDWMFWQRSILFWLEADGPEMFKVVISWISGALLPVVALGMTALVADNLKLKDGDENNEISSDLSDKDKKDLERFRGLESMKKLKESYNEDDIEIPNKEEQLEELQDAMRAGTQTISEEFPNIIEGGVQEVTPAIEVDIPVNEKDLMNQFKNSLNYDIESIDKSEPQNFHPPVDISTIKKTNSVDLSINKTDNKITKFPINRSRGWHLKKEFIDSNGDIYHYGIHQPKLVWENPIEVEESKKETE